MLNLIQLPFTLGNQIFKHLNEQDKKALTLTCRASRRWLCKMDYANKLAAKVEAFLIENCEILESTLPREELRFFPFHGVRLLGLAENHTNRAHRYLNAILAMLFWRMNSRLFIEGGKNSLAYSKSNGLGQFEHMPSHMIKEAKTWDVSFCPEYFRHLRNSLDFAKVTVKITKAALNLSFNRTQFSLKSYLHFIKRHFDSIQHEMLYQLFPFLQFKRKRLGCGFSQALLNNLRYHTFSLILYKNQALNQFYYDEMKHFSKIRERCLVGNFYKYVFCRQNSGIFISGKAHLNADVFSQTQEMRKKYKKEHPGALTDLIPVLFLAPSSTATISSIDKSFQRHFVDLRQEEIAEIPTADVQQHSSESISFVRDCIKNCDEKAIDIDTNHFGLWQSRCLICLYYERADAQKSLSKIDQLP